MRNVISTYHRAFGKAADMKREGRQHGMVRTHTILPSPWNPRPNSRVINQIDDSSCIAGSYARVSSKPTNHSKYTSKCSRPRCRECHSNPTCKSKVKAKGTLKLKPYDIMDGLDCVGASATRTLSCFSDDYLSDDGEDYIEDEELKIVSTVDASEWEKVEADDDWCLL